MKTHNTMHIHNRRSNKIRRIELIDTTLRDGAQAPGIILSNEQKVRIIEMLSSAGMVRFEAGIPASSEHDRSLFPLLKATFPACFFIAWCRASLSDLESAVDSSCDAVHISFPVSSGHQQISGFSEVRTIQLLEQCVSFAKLHFREVSVGAQDASRADSRFLTQFIEKAASLQVDRIRISDTVGILSPSSTKRLLARCTKAAGSTKIEFHGHNDLGMATANTISAFESGAASADVTIGGIGERTGNAALEEVVMALSITTRFSHSIDTTKLVPICTEFAQMMSIPISPMKPVIGSNIFCHESGIHTHGLLLDRTAYEPYPAYQTGHEPTQFVGGVQSGAAGIRYILEQHATSVTGEQLRLFLNYLKQQSLLHRKTYDEEEIDSLFKIFSNQSSI